MPFLHVQRESTFQQRALLCRKCEIVSIYSKLFGVVLRHSVAGRMHNIKILGIVPVAFGYCVDRRKPYAKKGYLLSIRINGLYGISNETHCPFRVNLRFVSASCVHVTKGTRVNADALHKLCPTLDLWIDNTLNTRCIRGLNFEIFWNDQVHDLVNTDTLRSGTHDDNISHQQNEKP